MIRLAGLMVAAALFGAADAQAQPRRVVSSCSGPSCAQPTYAAPVYAAPVYASPTYYAPAANYVPHVVVKNIVVQQDYFVEPQVTEVVEIYKGAAAKAYGLQQQGHYAYYPDQVAVIREVVRRKVILIEEEPEPKRK